MTVSASPGLSAWLRERGIALAITTYQAGRLLLVSANSPGGLSVQSRHFARAMGAWSDGDHLWLATKSQLWHLVDVTAGNRTAPAERNYLPNFAHHVGQVDTHDVAVDRHGRVCFVATKVNSLATLDPACSFRQLWQPEWIDRLVAQDRAHVNGLALRDGAPRYCTVCGETNTPKGWKQNRETGGVVVDIESNQIVARGLSMPHSPRWHDNRLWVLNSGEGQFGYVDLAAAGRFEPVAFCPGYLRGLSFVDRWALVGMSRPRHKTFQGLGLDAQLAARDTEPLTGVAIIDTMTGEVAHWLRIEGKIVELFDVVVLPRTTTARAVSAKNDDMARQVWVAVDDRAMLQPLTVARAKTSDDQPPPSS